MPYMRRADAHVLDNWGFADVEAAVNSIPSWIKQVKWQGPGVDVNRWVVTGHSNGGMPMKSLVYQILQLMVSRPGHVVCTHAPSRQACSRSTFVRLRFHSEYDSKLPH
jgi:hypothetical protein